MQLTIVPLHTQGATARQDAINEALTILAGQGREVVDYKHVAIKLTNQDELHILHQPSHDGTIGNLLAIDRIRDLIRERKPATKPEDEDYDDTESAHTNGYESALWDVLTEIEGILKTSPPPA